MTATTATTETINTAPPKLSASSKAAAWVVSHSDAIGLISVVGLFYVNFMFNFDYGKLMASGPDSELKFAWAFGLLESSALFLAGYLAVTGTSAEDRRCAFRALVFLMVLSFWTCYSSILASDARSKWDGDEIQVHNTLDSIRDVERNIKLTESAIASLNPSLFAQVIHAIIDKDDAPVGTLDDLNETLAGLRDEKALLTSAIQGVDNIERPQFAVFREVGGALGINPETVRMISRLVFGFAVIFSYCIVFRALTSKVLADRQNLAKG